MTSGRKKIRFTPAKIGFLFKIFFSIPGARIGDGDPLRRMGRGRISLTLQRTRVVLSFLKTLQFVVPNSFEQRFYESYICAAPGH
ncbi:hypothetical protein [Methylobacterium sp.]|uniref:hypothetical protein n=1 Tax=Methylobacterium sp. TaxID=409 RepID=UPI000FC31455|nr:hypothetical protein [Methylobacterium sp.]RUP23143.1 MAG: hypothetical protein EKK44_01220 [Methylobacterium sp.]